ncbi:MAG: DUF4097 family beta strand repeat-containing protein [Chloroflexota bacterium]
MLKKSLAVRPGFKIVIPSAPGDLRLTGWDREEVSAKSDGDELNLALNEETVAVSCDDDLIINVPRVASVQIDHAEGDVEVRMIAGGLSFGAVMGDLSLRDVGAVTIGSSEGDLAVRGATGGFNAGQLEGDASIRDLRGSLNLDSVAGDLFVRGVTGNVRAHTADDAVLHLSPQEGSAVDVTSEGDILLHIPANANATLSLSADDDISVHIPGALVSGKNPRSVVLGHGGSVNIRLSAEGDILVTSEAKDWESAAEFDFGGGWPLPDDFGERISRQVDEATRYAARHAEAAARRAEEVGRRAARQAEAAARRLEERARQQGRRFSFNWSPGRGAPPAPPSEPVSDAERMAILKMLQEKKISAEDAEKLLAALEGGR